MSCDRAVVGGDLRPAVSPALSPRPMRWSAAVKSFEECVRFKFDGGGLGLRGGHDRVRLLSSQLVSCRSCRNVHW